MYRSRTPLRFVLAASLLMSTPAFAHRPFFADGAYQKKSEAFRVQDPAESIVVNQTVRCDDQVLWLRFEAEAGQAVHFQIGVPMVDRLKDVRPEAILIGPGLESPPPLETGGLPSRALRPLESSTTFRDKESDTQSWVYIERDEIMPESGTYYVAAWTHDFVTGKLWVAIGTEERFTSADLPLFPRWLQQMNGFYEKTERGPSVETCNPEASFRRAESDATSSDGCIASARRPAPSASLLFVLFAGVVRFARRRKRYLVNPQYVGNVLGNPPA